MPANRVATVDVGAMEGTLKRIGGSQSDEWNVVIATQASNAIWKSADPKVAEDQLNAIACGLYQIAPKDELEGMLAAQLVASHNAAMECYRRAMIEGQTFIGRSEALTQANKLSRTHATLIEALNRHRGKGQQKVTVEHVHVHAGGQAVVGIVGPSPGLPGGGDRINLEEQSHAKQIPHALEPTLPSPNGGWDALPVSCDAERALPDARRQGSRRARGQSKRV
jgi:hypothetical protein